MVLSTVNKETTRMEIKQHPLSSAFPSMSESDQAALTADIDKNGQLDPITLFDGMVLDGWHRYQACCELGRDPKWIKLDKDIDPVVFVISHNFHRRHLTGSQRAIAVVSCNEWATVGKPKANMEPSSTLREMAKAADVSEKTIQHAKIADTAGLSDKVRDGELTAKKAAELVKTPKPANKPIEPGPEPQDETITIPKEQYDDMQDMLAQNLAEGLALEKLLDGNFMMEDAVNKITQQVAQVEQYKLRFEGEQNKNNELIKLIKTRDRQIAKLEKEIRGYKEQIKAFELEALPL